MDPWSFSTVYCLGHTWALQGSAESCTCVAGFCRGLVATVDDINPALPIIRNIYIYIYIYTISPIVWISSTVLQGCQEAKLLPHCLVTVNRALLRGWTMALSGVCAAVANLGVVLEIFTSLV